MEKMSSRERVINTLEFKTVDRFPRQLWALPGIFMFRREEHNALYARYEWDFGGSPVRYGKSRYGHGTPRHVGTYSDEFGCLFTVAQDGLLGEIKNPRINNESDLDAYEFPYEMLDGASLGDAEFRRSTDKFVLAGSLIRPFERMQFLRGSEELFCDIAEENDLFLRLLEKTHAFNLRDAELLAWADADGVSMMDDWGSQRSLLISPEKWRKYFKPLYKEYFEILRNAGKYVFFHSDGFIEEIYPDLIELGANAINSQLFCMDMEKLGNLYAGKVAFWGETDRQNILPNGTPADVENAVDRAAGALLCRGRTGVIAQCEWGLNDPAENIRAVFDSWMKH